MAVILALGKQRQEHHGKFQASYTVRPLALTATTTLETHVQGLLLQGTGKCSDVLQTNGADGVELP